MSKVWRIRKKTKEDLVEQLLANRGISTEKQKEDFFNLFSHIDLK